VIVGVTEDEFRLAVETDAVHPPDRMANAAASETRFERLKVEVPAFIGPWPLAVRSESKLGESRPHEPNHFFQYY
jgi:hypothetical protein